MAGPGEGGPVRLAILLGSLAGLLLVAVHTIGGSASLPVAVTGAAGAAVGDRIYALGGRLASGVPSNLIQEYDVATERAVIAGRLPQPVTDAAALTLDGFVYLLGGRANGSPTRQIVRFDAMRGTAVLAGPLPVPASGGRAAAARSRRGLPGGRIGARCGIAQLRDQPATTLDG